MSKGGSTNKKEPLKCPACGGDINDEKHGELPIGAGDYEGNSLKLGNKIINKVYNGKFYEHPFFYTADLNMLNLSNSKDLKKAESLKSELDLLINSSEKKNPRGGIQAHHLLSSNSVNKSNIFRKIIYFLGYDINHNKNGVLLTSIMKVACSFREALHRGNHDSALVINDNSRLEEMVFPVFESLDELRKLTYTSNVNKVIDRIISLIDITEDNFCNLNSRKKQAEKFINDMDEASENIFQKIYHFQWTLTSDGFDYQDKAVGCFDCNTLRDKRKKFKTEYNLKFNSKKTVIERQAILYNNKEKLNDILSYKCTHKIYKNPLKKFEHFRERLSCNLIPFKFE